MSELHLGAIEERFADIIWQNEPITSSELAKAAEEMLNWKKTTSYTVLKRLCDKGLFENNKGVVKSIISKAEYYSAQSEAFVNDNFDGSLPAFLAAFASRKKLTPSEVESLRKMVEEYEEGH